MVEMQNEIKKLFTAKELATYLGLSEQSVYRYVRQGIIPAKAIGRQRRFDREQVLAALDEDHGRKE